MRRKGSVAHLGDSSHEKRELPFGFEMCVVFAQFVDDGGIGSWACDNGTWTEF